MNTDRPVNEADRRPDHEPDDLELAGLAEAILEGEAVDWEALEGAAPPERRPLLQQLRLLAGVVALHRSLPSAELPRPWAHLKLLERVGEGAFGEVFLAWDSRLDREVALKLLRPEPESELAAGSSVIEEGRLLARVRHPNVVTVYGAERVAGQVGLWTEFVRGRTLEQWIRAQGPMSAQEATAVGIDLCSALAAVHGAGLLHRDIKARNVMREAGGRIVLMDFGAGRALGELTSGDKATGTPLYLAPEIFEGQAATARSDIYSLSVLLYFLVTGSYPVQGRSLEELRSAHRQGRRVFLRDARPDLSEAFIEAVEKGLAADPAARHETAGALQRALRKTQGSGVVALPTSSAAPAPRFRRGVLVAAAVLIAAALTIVATLRTRFRAGRTAVIATPSASTHATSEAVEELLARSRYLRNHKRLPEARRFVEEALKLEPQNPQALAGLALNLFGEGETEEARETARRALELDPNTWEAHRLLGNLAVEYGDLRAADFHYRRAVAANPTDYKTRNRYARHLLAIGRLEDAKEQMLESKRMAPEDPDVQNIWIQYALLTGDYESAIRQGEIWLAVWEKQIPDLSVVVRDMLGAAYAGARRQADAIAQFRAADPDNDLSIALALGYAGRIGEARALLEAQEAAAVTGNPTDPGHEGAMAMVYIVIGDFDHAFEHLDREVASGSYPAWVHYPMFRPLRNDPRWPAFEQRLEQLFFSGKEGTKPQNRDMIWRGLPHPAKPPSR